MKWNLTENFHNFQNFQWEKTHLLMSFWCKVHFWAAILAKEIVAFSEHEANSHVSLPRNFANGYKNVKYEGTSSFPRNEIGEISIGAPLLIENFQNYRILWSDSWLKILKIFIIFKIFNEKRRTNPLMQTHEQRNIFGVLKLTNDNTFSHSKRSFSEGQIPAILKTPEVNKKSSHPTKEDFHYNHETWKHHSASASINSSFSAQLIKLCTVNWQRTCAKTRM